MQMTMYPQSHFPRMVALVNPLVILRESFLMRIDYYYRVTKTTLPAVNQLVNYYFKKVDDE